jgi:glutaredoxin
MKNLNIIVYTMKGCPFCDDFKKMLTEKNIEFFDRDIFEHESEYDIFSEITNNDMVPALLIIEGDDKDYKSFLYAPERNYNELTDAIDIINEHRKNVGIIK